MRATRAVLAIVDISGYTRFIVDRVIALTHAEQIITDLIETLIDHSEHPFVVNKLEGDAMLLFAETGGDDRAAGADTLKQISRAFRAFEQRLHKIRSERSHCHCEACANVNDLRLKAFLHLGDITVKQVRQFEEIAGEDVILIHRLLKNSVPSREYVLMTLPYFDTVSDQLPRAGLHSEDAEGIGRVELRLLGPEALPG